MSSDLKQENGYKLADNNNINDVKPNKGKGGLRVREFKVRESIMRTLLEENPHVQSMAAFASAALWFHFIILILFNQEQFRKDLTFLHWGLIQNFDIFLLIWCQMFVQYIAFYSIAKQYIEKTIP